MHDGLNLYVYCSNRPLIHIDPSGMVEVGLRDYAATYPGAIVGWDPKTYTATVTYQGKTLSVKSTSENNRGGHIYIDDSLFVETFGVGSEKLVVYQNNFNISIRARFSIEGQAAQQFISGKTTYGEAFLQGILTYWNGFINDATGSVYKLSTYAEAGEGGISVVINDMFGRAKTDYAYGNQDNWGRGDTVNVILYRGQTRNYTLKRFYWTSAHEFGHVLGVRDAYKTEHYTEVTSILNKVYMPVTANDIRLAILAWNSGQMQDYVWRRSE